VAKLCGQKIRVLAAHDSCVMSTVMMHLAWVPEMAQAWEAPQPTLE
jgi:hypothetical protein